MYENTMNLRKSTPKEFHDKEARELLLNTVGALDTVDATLPPFMTLQNSYAVLLTHLDNGYIDNDIDKLLSPLYSIALEIILEKAKDSNRATFNNQFVVYVVLFCRKTKEFVAQSTKCLRFERR